MCCCDVVCSVVFWLGDLNYRLDDIDNDECKEKISRGQLDDLWRNNDQVLTNYYVIRNMF